MDSSQITDSSIVDLVLLFAENLVRSGGQDVSEKVFQKLACEGFSKEQIEQAFSLAIERVILAPQNESVRIFNESELKSFSPEAAAILVKLNQLGIIDNEQVEIILMRAAFTPDEQLTEDELKMIVAMILSKSDANIPTGFFVPDEEDNIH